MDYLNRSQAPFGVDLWKKIDAAAIDAARDALTARRFLEVDGPYGVGLTSIEIGNDVYCRDPGPDEAGAVMSRAISVPMFRKGFRLSVRRIASSTDQSQPLSLAPVEDAAEAVAAREEEMVYYGNTDFGLEGLLTAKGRHAIDGGDWSNIDQALQDVLAAVNKLDESGLRGPYALALSPKLYNSLFRRYDGSDVLQLEHINSVCTVGIFKAPIEGGVLIDPRVGVLVVGQDLRAGYASHDGIHHHLYLAESLVLRIDDPKAVCTIGADVGGLLVKKA
ncbi:family 1 encapsulin nanocompartment shell protein [Tistrella bauzanensis]|jgi:uncharacterized linocin/CFP29 family protein|uniref:family 1 encapsulin nanocompartment shell protein n=1 Tax=Tistrella TaxID=171436 RepID=UPI0031F712F4